MFFPPRRKPVRERRFLIRTFLQLRRKHVRQSAHRPIPNDWTSCAYLPMKRRRSFRRYFTVSWNGGIILSPITKAHPQSDPKKPLLVLGEYRNSPQMGRSIVLYGGSILRSYGNLPDEKLKAEVRHILRHEFTHHLESLSGTNDLEIDDAVKLNRYKASIHAE